MHDYSLLYLNLKLWGCFGLSLLVLMHLHVGNRDKRRRLAILGGLLFPLLGHITGLLIILNLITVLDSSTKVDPPAEPAPAYLSKISLKDQIGLKEDPSLKARMTEWGKIVALTGGISILIF